MNFSVFMMYISCKLPKAMTAEQRAMVREHFEKVGMECLKSHPVTPDDINALRSRKLPTGEKAPCFLACVFKEIGIVSNVTNIRLFYRIYVVC